MCGDFEEQFAAHVGARYAISCSSGTAALHICYVALLQPGDEVLAPSFTFIATASMASMMGALPVFCDVLPRTYNLDIDDARRRITRRTRALAPVHLFGNPCDVDGIQALAQEFGLKIIWDAAQAHGARYRNQDVGSFGDCVCYSFYPSKNMTTAEGGMITMNDAGLYEKCKRIRSHGESGRYHHTALGFNYRLTDVMASLGIEQLKKLDGWIAKRRSNARVLTRELAGIAGLHTPVETKHAESSFNLYSITIDREEFGCDRDEVARRLAAGNIGSAVHYPRCLHEQPVYAGFAPQPLPVGEGLSRRILSVPVEASLGEPEMRRVAEALRNARVREECVANCSSFS